MRDIYAPIDTTLVVTNIKSAELIKHASNSFLATKISFTNALATICELSGANIDEVTYGMGLDDRIGSRFLNAGVGYGGSCFPKDVKALAYMAAEKGRHPQLLNAVMEINNDRRSLAVIESGGELYDGEFASGRRVRLPWGLSGFDIGELNKSGRDIMKRSIEWAAGKEQP